MKKYLSLSFGKLEGKAPVYQVNSANITDENSVDEQKVKTETKEIPVNENGFTYSFRRILLR